MPEADHWLYEFGPFRLDAVERVLSRDGSPVPLTGKVFDLLLLLIERRGRALGKLELMQQLWPDSVVAENNLTVNMSALRKALGESAAEPHYIQTLPRRGYRFVGEVQQTRAALGPLAPAAQNAPASVALARALDTQGFVGREHELERLRELLARAALGRGRVVFVSGGAGLGKSTLVERFLQEVRTARQPAQVLVGRCLEQYGASEAYLPLLEAIRGALFGDDQERVRRVFRTHAPSWSLLFPAAFAASAREGTERDAQHMGGPRLLRELGDALAALAIDTPLVLLLEDLHWADPSSIDVLRFLGQRCRAWPLLLIGTLRPDGQDAEGLPLRKTLQELVAHDQCDELPLPLLDVSQVGAYLQRHFEPNDFPDALRELLWSQTEGQPLFLTRLSQLLAERGDVARGAAGWSLTRPVAELELGVPNSVRALIARKLDSLAELERRGLEAASVQGEEFSLLVLARQLELTEVTLEAALEPLDTSHRLIRRIGEQRFPDGRVATRYRFAHVLYQNVLYQGLTPLWRRQLHAGVARELLAHHPNDIPSIVAQLGLHFERAGDAPSAIRYLMQAADRAGRLLANREACRHYARAFALIEQLLPSEQLTHHIILHYNLGWVHFTLHEIEPALEDFTRMLEYTRSPELASPDRAAALAAVFDYLEQPWQDAFGALEPPRMPLHLRHMGPAAIECEALCGLCHCLLYAGRLDDFMQRAREFLRLTEAHADEAHRADALGLVATGLVERQDRAAAKPLLDESIALARVLDLPRGLGTATAIRADIHLHEGEYDAACALYREALDLSFQAMGVVYCLSGLGLALAHRGRVSEAIAALTRARDVAARSSETYVGDVIPSTLGWIYLELGDFERALEHDRAGAKLTERQGLQQAALHSRLNLHADHSALRQCAARATDQLARGELDAAERDSNELLSSATLGAAAKYVVLAHRLLADIHAARGDDARALAQLDAGEHALGERAIPFVACRLFAARARLLTRAGELEKAAAARQRALSVVQEIAANIDDEALRSRFLRQPDLEPLFR